MTRTKIASGFSSFFCFLFSLSFRAVVLFRVHLNMEMTFSFFISFSL